MIVTIRGEAHECRTAAVENGRVILYLGKYDERGEEVTSVFAGFSADEITGLEAHDAPTLDDRVATLETDTADLAEALDMILSGVTE